ncbi:hypothetical protein TNIN_124591 [Trichonephila inaurata madagascariensis]|uniref:Uncharacterized protein n=1 Tax=Trichonephila inaurata madagascariensis TaxID=2747483 RepID=A0A8X7C8A1_9ARAC|nr:hypothetical protein TNIN_124591 [Trichonephila inaurata madagascariensis]
MFRPVVLLSTKESVSREASDGARPSVGSPRVSPPMDVTAANAAVGRPGVHNLKSAKTSAACSQCSLCLPLYGVYRAVGTASRRSRLKVALGFPMWLAPLCRNVYALKPYFQVQNLIPSTATSGVKPEKPTRHKKAISQ